jgi:ribosomal protein S18 acetylase RimI-like enzyme
VPDDLDRALAFILQADMAGTILESHPWGHVVRMPECPLRHDSNYLVVGRGARAREAEAWAAEAERALGAAGLGHRMVMFRDAAAGEACTAGFEALGWRPDHGVVMALRRSCERRPGGVDVVRAEPEALREARTAEILTYPWATPEVARQILAARSFVPVETRHYAVFEGDVPVSWAELYLEGAVAQIEAVATTPPYRNRGYASAVVRHAAAEARAAGTDLVFLCADADDWPRHLYERLGFDGIGRYLKFRLEPAR